MSATIPIIQVPEDADLDINVITDAAADQLGPNSYWGVADPDGRLIVGTESKSLIDPIITACQMLDAEWDDLTEAGCHLAKFELEKA